MVLCPKCGQSIRANNSYHGSKQCKTCVDRYWAEWNTYRKNTYSLHDYLKIKLKSARRRSKARHAIGSPLTMQELLDTWHTQGGRCANCSNKMSFEWHPRARPDNHAVVDRIDSSKKHNRTYGSGNARWLCMGCNRERSGFELARNLEEELSAREAEIRKLRKACRDRCYRVLRGGGFRDRIHDIEGERGVRLIRARRTLNAIVKTRVHPRFS